VVDKGEKKGKTKIPKKKLNKLGYRERGGAKKQKIKHGRRNQNKNLGKKGGGKKER